MTTHVRSSISCVLNLQIKELTRSIENMHSKSFASGEIFSSHSENSARILRVRKKKTQIPDKLSEKADIGKHCLLLESQGFAEMTSYLYNIILTPFPRILFHTNYYTLTVALYFYCASHAPVQPNFRRYYFYLCPIEL